MLGWHGSIIEEPGGVQTWRQVNTDRHEVGNVWRRRTFDKAIAEFRPHAPGRAQRRGVSKRKQLIRAPR